MGEVYRARHLHLDEIRIIKVTKPDAVRRGGSSRAGSRRRRASRRSCATRTSPPSTTSRACPTAPSTWCGSSSTASRSKPGCAGHGPLPAARALDVARQVLAGLAEIHAQGIVHRDLSPDNIMLRESAGRAAPGQDHRPRHRQARRRRVRSQMTGTGLFLGKLKYCSPEQAGALPPGETLDARSDLYSFGVVLYEMLAGKAAVRVADARGILGKHLHAAPPPLDTSPAAAARSARGSRDRQAMRSRRIATGVFATAEEFRRALAALEPAAQPTVAMRRRPPHRERRPFPFAAAAAHPLAGALAGYAVILVSRRGRRAGGRARRTSTPKRKRRRPSPLRRRRRTRPPARSVAAGGSRALPRLEPQRGRPVGGRARRRPRAPRRRPARRRPAPIRRRGRRGAVEPPATMARRRDPLSRVPRRLARPPSGAPGLRGARTGSRRESLRRRRIRTTRSTAEIAETLPAFLRPQADRALDLDRRRAARSRFLLRPTSSSSSLRPTRSSSGGSRSAPSAQRPDGREPGRPELRTELAGASRGRAASRSDPPSLPARRTEDLVERHLRRQALEGEEPELRARRSGRGRRRRWRGRSRCRPAARRTPPGARRR